MMAATDFFGANAQATAVQKLYLMNSGYNEYGTVIPLISSTIEGLGHANQQICEQQQHPEFSIPLPPGHLAMLSNTNMMDLLANHASVHGHAWGDANELPFLPCNGVVGSNDSLISRIGSVNGARLSQYGVESMSNSLSYREHAPLPTNAAAAQLNMESLQASSNAGQILSLSLSPQRPPIMQLQPLQQSNSIMPNYDVNTSLGAQNISMSGGGFLNQLNGMSNARISSTAGRPSVVGIYESKYLQAAQELLNAVVSVRQGITDAGLKHQKSLSWVGDDSPLAPNSSLSNAAGKNSEQSNLDSANDGNRLVAAANPSMGAVNTRSGCPSSDIKLAELTPAESQELQTKKAKLMAMRDEVDRRYKQYYHQLKIVVVAFESGAGLGAARVYTALALHTISRHFRCLRDAISGQIEAISCTLGEEDVSGQGISRLRFVDQQLRQQRMLRQLGMMQQNAWRPQRGLPEHSVSILRAWLFEHFLHPYPKDADKIMLARQTGLTRNQVSNWFINARVRLWKPMVEEMYAEEVRNQDAEWAATRSTQNLHTSKEIRGPMGDDDTGNVTKRVNAEVNEDNCDDVSEMGDGCSPDIHMNGQRQGSKLARIGLQDADVAAECGNNGLSMTMEPHANIHDIREPTEGYNMMCFNGPETDYGSFRMNTFSHDSTALLQHHSTTFSGGISLTLGLQHCDVLPSVLAPAEHEEMQTELLRGQVQQGYLSPSESSYLQQHKHFRIPGLRHDFST